MKHSNNLFKLHYDLWMPIPFISSIITDVHRVNINIVDALIALMVGHRPVQSLVIIK